MGILEGKNILVAGVTLDSSIGFHVARIAQAEGATVIVSNFGRAMSLTGRVIKKLDPVPPLLEVDVTNEDHLAGLADQIGQHVDHLDGLVHSLAFANPETALGGKFLSTPWADVATALQVSAYSLASLTMACKPVLAAEASVVGLTFDARISWPVYDWMGVSKSALESTSRYLARYLGTRGHPGQSGRRRTAGNPGQEGDRRGRRVQHRLGPAGADRLGPQGHEPDGQGRGGPAQRLLPQDHRRDDPRRWRSALHRGVSTSRVPSRRFGCSTGRISTSRGPRPRSPSISASLLGLPLDAAVDLGRGHRPRAHPARPARLGVPAAIRRRGSSGGWSAGWRPPPG